ncbi:putative cystathionine beta-lyase PatB [delta proteobacterium NaphS2]|nr:putative cystathionine beta-lyase PatB [delta proteobacterium NaphS2]
MKYDFDMEIDRRNSYSLKWEFMHTGGKLAHTTRFLNENRVLPMWVADMDFVSPKPVVDALTQRAQHGIYGYTAPTQSFYNSVIGWMERRHGWRVGRQWICVTPGVVPALNMLVRAFASPGDRVLIQPPVYHPFYGAIENNGAEPALNPLILENGRYGMDITDLETKCKDPRVKLAVLCSPHNPVGRVWTRDELICFGEICLDNDILVVSDEIHGDLIYRDNVFTPFASISEVFSENSITCTSPSKTFNLAGLQTSCIIIPNPDLRSRFEKILQRNGLFGLGAFGAVALQAAYDHGEEWLVQLLEYIKGNLEYLEAYVVRYIPQLTVIRPEGTYLVWLDCRGLGLDKRMLKKFMLEEAGVYLDAGFIFGPEGEGFERINIACPRSILAEALDRIREAVGRFSSDGARQAP